jgi:hypothetical protein
VRAVSNRGLEKVRINENKKADLNVVTGPDEGLVRRQGDPARLAQARFGGREIVFFFNEGNAISIGAQFVLVAMSGC